MFAGLLTALDTRWSEPSLRFMVLVGDASSHEVGHPQATTGLDAPSLRQQLNAQRVSLVALHLEDQRAAPDHALDHALVQVDQPSGSTGAWPAVFRLVRLQARILLGALKLLTTHSAFMNVDRPRAMLAPCRCPLHRGASWTEASCSRRYRQWPGGRRLCGVFWNEELVGRIRTFAPIDATARCCPASTRIAWRTMLPSCVLRVSAVSAAWLARSRIGCSVRVVIGDGWDHSFAGKCAAFVGRATQGCRTAGGDGGPDRSA